MKSSTTIINVVSGKGGTGKTLLVSVLADILGNSPNAKTLVIDLDVFVRGLTSLLYFHREEKLRISERGKLSVADLFVQKVEHESGNASKLAIRLQRLERGHASTAANPVFVGHICFGSLFRHWGSRW